MPAYVGAWIQTDKQVRRLLPEELGKGLGVSKAKLETVSLSGKLLQGTTSLFHWEYLSGSLNFPSESAFQHDFEMPHDAPNQTIQEVLAELLKINDHPKGDFQAHPVDWKLPNLRIGGAWYLARIATLTKVASEYGTDAPRLVKEGKAILDIHRNNYDCEGPRPQRLQLIWWEFPVEHRDAI